MAQWSPFWCCREYAFGALLPSTFDGCSCSCSTVVVLSEHVPKPDTPLAELRATPSTPKAPHSMHSEWAGFEALFWARPQWHSECLLCGAHGRWNVSGFWRGSGRSRRREGRKKQVICMQSACRSHYMQITYCTPRTRQYAFGTVPGVVWCEACSRLRWIGCGKTWV